MLLSETRTMHPWVTPAKAVMLSTSDAQWGAHLVPTDSIAASVNEPAGPELLSQEDTHRLHAILVSEPGVPVVKLPPALKV